MLYWLIFHLFFIKKKGDIDVVAAMGDGLTVATGANAVNFVEAAVENRGLSFSIGGKVFTCPN